MVCVCVFVSFVVVSARRNLRPCLDIMSVHRFLWLRRHKQLKQSQMITLITHEHRKLERKEREGGVGVAEWKGGRESGGAC